jgi:ABC-type dipeptide/oligopeptide/nickel transport system ATPase component
MAGMNVEEKEDMSRFILDVNDEFGTTIALIEHDMSVVMDISDRVVVMDYGKKIGDGTPHDVRNNQAVIDAYLGVSHDYVQKINGAATDVANPTHRRGGVNYVPRSVFIRCGSYAKRPDGWGALCACGFRFCSNF